MKKSVILAISLTCLVICGQAQTSLKNEVHLGYGLVSIPFMIEQTGNLLFTVFTLGLYDGPDRISSTGVINFGYYYALSNRVSIGADYGWKKNSIKWEGDRSEGFESYTISISSLMAGLKYKFIVNPNFG